MTDGSVYRPPTGNASTVKIYWFDNTGVATYSRDGGASISYSKGTTLSTNGSYEFTLTITEDGVDYSKTIHFEIDSSTQTDIATLQNSLQTNLDIELSGGVYDAKGPITAIWAEDMDGNFLQNIYVSTTAAANTIARVYNIPYWAHKTCPENSSGNYLVDPYTPLPEGIDAVSGASQKGNFVIHSSVLPPESGNTIRVRMEMNQSWDTGWYFKADHVIDSAEEPGEVDGNTFGSVINTNGEPSLVFEVVVPLDQPGTYTVDMYTQQNPVSIPNWNYYPTPIPTGYGHYAGKTETLYTDFEALNPVTERQQHKFSDALRMLSNFSVTVNRLPGDLTGNMEVDLEDAIRCLKLCTGVDVEVNPNSDIGENNRIGMEEALYILRVLSE